MKFAQPDLPYSYDSLEPYIDAATMRVHYDKHHRGYTDNLNNALSEINVNFESIEELMHNLSRVPMTHRQLVRNNAGGYYTHNLYWTTMTPDFKDPSTEFSEVLTDNFSSFEKFKLEFEGVALKRFGSGWAWLVIRDSKLEVLSSANQDSPLSEGLVPILGLDVWEHAYYLKYQNKRADYIKSWWNIVNWSAVEQNYKNGKNN